MGGVWLHEWDGEQYAVRPVSGHAAGKTYVCPGCQQLIRPRQPHVVVWPSYQQDATDRRHWHRVCWDARDRRPPR